MRSPVHGGWPNAHALLRWAIAATLFAMMWSGFAMIAAAEAVVETGHREARVLGLSSVEAYRLHESTSIALCVLVISDWWATRTS